MSLCVMTISTVVLLMVVRFPVNGWTLRSVAYSLQDGCLASICTSNNEDSEMNLWGLTVGCCRNGGLGCHVSWLCGARVADQFNPLFDPCKHPHLPFLAIQNGKRSFRRTVTHTAARMPPQCHYHSGLRLSTKLTSPHPSYIVPQHPHLQLFHQVVSERQSHNADDLALTNEDFRDDRNDKIRSQCPRRGPVQSHAALPDSRMCLTRTRACSA